jgi:transcriptional regulator with XRE-family HTH domain
MNIGENIKMLRKRSKKSQEEVSSALGLTRSSYSGYENGVAEPSIETIIQLSNYFSIPLDVLLKKDLTTFTENQWQSFDSGILSDVYGKNIRILTSLVNEQEEELIEMVTHKAQAGYVSGYADPEYLKVLPTFSLPFLSKDRKYRSFPISGDSMPPVSDGSFVVAEFVQNWMILKDGTPCIVVTKDEGIVFKILYNNLKKNQSFTLCSTNSFYKPYEVHANEVVEVWRFVNYISPDLPEVKMDDASLGQTLIELQKDLLEIKKQLSDSKS